MKEHFSCNVADSLIFWGLYKVVESLTREKEVKKKSSDEK